MKTCKYIFTVAGYFLIYLLSISLARSEPGWPLEVNVFAAKSDRLNRVGEIDDRDVKFGYNCELVNRDIKRTLEGVKVTLIALARDVVHHETMVLLTRDSTTMTLPPYGKGKFQGQLTRLEYDDKYFAKHGYKPYGYVIVVQVGSGNVIYAKASPPGLEKQTAQLMKIPPGSLFDKKTLTASGTAFLR